METASKDVLFTIALELPLPDLLKWCSSNSKINRDVCGNENVWRSKLLQDFKDVDYQKFKLNRSLRETYVFLYQLSYFRDLLETDESLYDIFLKKEIDLSGKGLKKVPAFDLPNLQKLNLAGNSLTKVPVFNLPNLRELYLGTNKITKVPLFNNLPNLQLLYLGYNNLREVPAFTLPKLRALNLENNALAKVPSFDLPSLRTLILNNNNLTNLPVLKFPKLKKLYFINNQISKKVKRDLKEKYGKKIII